MDTIRVSTWRRRGSAGGRRYFLIYLAIYQLPENHSSIKLSALTADCCLGCTSMMQRDAPDDDDDDK